MFLKFFVPSATTIVHFTYTHTQSTLVFRLKRNEHKYRAMKKEAKKMQITNLHILYIAYHAIPTEKRNKIKKSNYITLKYAVVVIFFLFKVYFFFSQ